MSLSTDIASVVDRNDGWEAATRSVVAGGAEAVPLILQAAADDPRPPIIRRLADLVSVIMDPAATWPLREGLRATELPLPLRSACYRTIGRLGGEGALEFLGAALEQPTRLPVVSALGELRDARAAGLLQAAYDALPAGTEWERRLSYIEAMAKSGDHTQAELVQAAARKGDEFATRALSWCVGPGIVQTLQVLTKHPSDRIRFSAANALFYVGTREVVPILSLLTGDKDNGVAFRATALLRVLVGNDNDFTDRLDVAEHVCLRRGRPIDFAVLVEETRTNDDRDVAEEVLYRLGARLGASLPPLFKISDQEADQRASAWIEANTGKYKVGAHYRFGYPVDV